jgi:hypothetical protein
MLYLLLTCFATGACRLGNRREGTDAAAIEKLAFYTLNWLTLTYEESQIYGVAFLADASNLQLHQFETAIPRALFKILQEVMPVRVKAIYIVNQPTFFSVVFQVVRFFIHEKVRRRINLVGDATHPLLSLLVRRLCLPFCCPACMRQ